MRSLTHGLDELNHLPYAADRLPRPREGRAYSNWVGHRGGGFGPSKGGLSGEKDSVFYACDLASRRKWDDGHCKAVKPCVGVRLIP